MGEGFRRPARVEYNENVNADAPTSVRFDMIAIPKGNAFTLKIPIYLQDGTPVIASTLKDVKVIVQNEYDYQEEKIPTYDGKYVCLTFNGSLSIGAYSVFITGKLGDRDIAYNMKHCFHIVPFTSQSTLVKPLSPIDKIAQDWIVLGLTDEELTRLKDEYARLIAEQEQYTEEAKEYRDRMAEFVEEKLPLLFELMVAIKNGFEGLIDSIGRKIDAAVRKIVGSDETVTLTSIKESIEHISTCEPMTEQDIDEAIDG